jgi:hypothetical protein
MVSPAKASDHPVTHRRWYSRWTKWPSQCTDAMHLHTVGLSGAEEHPLGAVLCSSNNAVGWTVEVWMKRLFIRCWTKNLVVSLYDLNVGGVRWTASQSIGSSNIEEAELWTLLLPNPRSPDEPMLGSSVDLTVSFENSSHRTHPTNVEKRVSIHPTLWLELWLIQFNRLWVFRGLFCFQCVFKSTLSWLASKELECAYFHGFWCMVKLLVYEPLLIVRSNTTN